MAKTILGIDIGCDSLKMALVSGKQVRRTAIVPMPVGMLREGRIISTETMGEFLRTAAKENGMRSSHGAIVLPNETVFLRSVTMPLMPVDQLNYNLPFEFRDYITDELKDYLFDYAVIETHETPAEGEENEGGGPTMDLMAVAAHKSLLDEARLSFHRAGMKLAKAAPSVCCFQALIRAVMDPNQAEPQEYCILDLGYQAIRMYMFRGDRHIVTRVLEIGLSSLDRVIADAYSVDEHLAHSYLLNNFEDCQNKDYCVNAYGNITVELMRALNFYRFSNPDSHLEDIWICGGGTLIRPLQTTIAETLDLRIHSADELIPGGEYVESAYAMLQAIGVALC